MSTSRFKRPNSKTVSKTRFLRSRSRFLFVSKPVIPNPKYDANTALNIEPQFIVAPIRGRVFRKSPAQS